MKSRGIRTSNPKILRPLKRILLSGFLCALCAFAVNAGQHFHREDAKDAKKTLRTQFGCGFPAPGESEAGESAAPLAYNRKPVQVRKNFTPEGGAIVLRSILDEST